jgi:hypothetical protein
VRVLALLPPARMRLRLFHSAEAKVFWEVAGEAVVLSLPVPAVVVPCAIQGHQRLAVGGMDSATPAVWEWERSLVLGPRAPRLVEAPR